MVASAFTIVSFGGTGYKIIKDGYVQLVSVFVIFCADGVLSESGGYASVTNSASNFGTYALRATGYRAEPYSFDVGTIGEDNRRTRHSLFNWLHVCEGAHYRNGAERHSYILIVCCLY